ncbi:MAG TPA: hypothetical protein PKD86_03945 [Gemmatales bacterium]|nr:hypothetical protein [Gemmatales bacterium]
MKNWRLMMMGIGIGALLPALAASVLPLASAQPGGGPPTGTAPQQQSLPVVRVVLFSSGVGYFEHFGTVAGNTTTELRFKTAQINDILKSLVLQDMDGGKVTTITYPSQDPISKTLRSFQVDITDNPSLADLLNQLRGAKVKVSVATTELAGTILGVETKQKPIGDGKFVPTPVLNLLAGATIRSVELPDVRELSLEDPQLQAELTQALVALAAARDQDKKPVGINFLGEGERRVRVGYVVETPIWKTSYRLILDDPKAVGEDGKPKPGGNLQGWAIVENQTDNDWTNVQLSLVSGRPISFVQDLYQPLYLPRPVVQPQLYASLRPQQYEGGWGGGGAGGTDDRAMNAPAPASPMPSAARARREAGAAGGRLGTAAEADEMQALDAAKSIESVASAAQVGELFQYTVGNVSLPRQKSAMIPIITDPLSVERVSIFNLQVLAKHPLNGAILTNTTDKHLLTGPITVFDGGGYAGDAQIDNVPPGQQRLLSYGIDLQVVADAAKNEQTNTIQTGKIVRGVLNVQRKVVHKHTYAFENKSPTNKTIVVEHGRFGGDWTLVDTPEPFEKTDDVYRFKLPVEANKTNEIAITQQIVQSEGFAILNADVGQLQFYSRQGAIPQNVRDALIEAMNRKVALVEVERKINEVDRQLQSITQEQTRIRENVRTINDRNDAYYNRLLKKLDEQESQIEKLQQDRAKLVAEREQKQAELENYLQNLNVG